MVASFFFFWVLLLRPTRNTCSGFWPRSTHIESILLYRLLCRFEADLICIPSLSFACHFAQFFLNNNELWLTVVFFTTLLDLDFFLCVCVCVFNEGRCVFFVVDSWKITGRDQRMKNECRFQNRNTWIGGGQFYRVFFYLVLPDTLPWATQ